MAKQPIPVKPTTKSSTTPVDEPGESKIDRFHPEMPQIPGVRSARAGSPKQIKAVAWEQLLRTGGMIAAVVVIAVAILWWIKSAPRTVVQSPSSEPAVEETPIPEPAAPARLANEGPTIAATVEELSKPWAAKKFSFVNPLTQESIEAMVIRLPGRGLWAFALQEPYGKCDLEFVTDLSQIASKYGYRASHPMVVNSCSSTVYDPLKLGSLGTNTWVRGEIVQGGGLRPPISIDVQVKGHFIIADRIE